MKFGELESFVKSLENKEALAEYDIFKLINIFNNTMLSNVDGPNCTDRKLCLDNCCNIMIDIPHILAREYIEKNLLSPLDLVRGDVFAWQLNVKPETNRCCFFSDEIYGCTLYVEKLHLRPPQCAVYPAGYVEGAKSCKSNLGPWIVKDARVGELCRRMMNLYKSYCIHEKERIERELIENIPNLFDENFKDSLCSMPPSHITGIKDTWMGFRPLDAEGRSLSFKRFCMLGKTNCHVEFLECQNVCEQVANIFIKKLIEIMPSYLRNHGMKESYLILEIFKQEN
ncbi:MAG: hypothetical protein ACTSXP_18825 [Promethearchaeota archaeon]